MNKDDWKEERGRGRNTRDAASSQNFYRVCKPNQYLPCMESKILCEKEQIKQ